MIAYLWSAWKRGSHGQPQDAVVKRILLYEGWYFLFPKVNGVLSAPRYKKGDVVMVDEDGKAVKFEIVSVLATNNRLKDVGERLYEGRNVSNGALRTIAHDEVLRRATPVDSSAELFDQVQSSKKIK